MFHIPLHHARETVIESTERHGLDWLLFIEYWSSLVMIDNFTHYINDSFQK